MNESQLIKAVRSLVEKGDRAKEKSEQFYIAAGLHLKTLKDQHGGTWAEWETYVKDAVGIGKSRASELMQIADGRKTVEQVRDNRAMRDAKSQTKPMLSADDGENENETDEVFEQFYPDPRLGPPMRRQGLLNRAADAVRLAKYDDLNGLAIDDTMRSAIEEAADAWNVLASRTQRRAS